MDLKERSEVDRESVVGLSRVVLRSACGVARKFAVEWLLPWLFMDLNDRSEVDRYRFAGRECCPAVLPGF